MSGAVPVPAPAAAPAATSRKATAEGWVRENLEAVAVAVVMALLIRHFCVEAFRIPTSSMEPTLYGAKNDRAGDRILVNKFRYLFTEPERFDVVVFRYPLNRDRNYIKRIGGLPGDELDIRGGDLFVDGRIMRKPPHIQASLWRTAWDLAVEAPTAARNEGFDRKLRDEGLGDPPAGNVGVRRFAGMGFRDPSQAWRVEDGQIRADCRGTAEAAWVTLPEQTGANEYVARDDQLNDVADLRLACTVRLAAGAHGAWLAEVGPPASRFRARVPTGGGAATLERRVPGGDAWTAIARADVAPLPDRPVRLVAGHVDGVVEVTLDGQVLLTHAYEPDAPAWTGADWNGLPRLGLEDAACEITALTVERDQHWLREGADRLPLRVPPGHYVMLGDNSGHSKDSRMWRRVAFDLVPGLVAGNRIVGDGDASARGDDGLLQYQRDPDRGTLELVDETGFRWELTRAQVPNFDAPQMDGAPFVPRENIVGQAFFVFYPFRRWSFIR